MTAAPSRGGPTPSPIAAVTPATWKLVIPRPWRRSRQAAGPWLIPATYAAGAIVAGLSLPRLEYYLLPWLPSTISVGAAMSIYASIASGMLALTGIVFSLTIVMVQFSATAYSPRLVLWVARDPVVSHALGIFTATFLYAIAALAWVDRAASGRVSLLSAMAVVALLLTSVAVFIALIQRIGLLQINRMLAFTGEQGRKVIDSMYPPLETASAASSLPPLPAAAITQVLVHRDRPRAIQAIDTAALVRLAKQAGAVIELTSAVGDTALDSTPLLRVFGGTGRISERRLAQAIHTGEERTFDQDPEVRHPAAGGHRDPRPLAGGQRSDDGRPDAGPDWRPAVPARPAAAGDECLSRRGRPSAARPAVADLGRFPPARAGRDPRLRRR